jgi:hypothetical protein
VAKVLWGSQPLVDLMAVEQRMLAIQHLVAAVEHLIFA